MPYSSMVLILMVTLEPFCLLNQPQDVEDAADMI
jgi:hypothetical protein